jgi:hypothetical protein
MILGEKWGRDGFGIEKTSGEFEVQRQAGALG